MRSIAQQSVDEMGGRGSVLVRQKRDHVALDVLLERLLASSAEQQQEVLTRVGRLVFPHAFAEEAVLWPALRRTLPAGEQLTVRVEQEHQEINAIFDRLETAAFDDPGRPALIAQIVDLLRQDVRDEEDVLLPRLQDRLGSEELRRLGRRWEMVRRTAPTRPHPIVARRPPGNVLAALPLSLIDRARDRLDRVARHTGGPPRSALRAASRALAHAARRIECVGAMRAGERQETRISDHGR